MSVPSSVRSRRKKQQNREETGRVRADREETQRRSEEQEEQEEEEECGAEFQEELQRRLCSPAGSMRWQPRRVLIRLQERSREEERDREKQEIRATPEKFGTNHSVHQRAVYTHRSHSPPRRWWTAVIYTQSRRDKGLKCLLLRLNGQHGRRRRGFQTAGNNEEPLKGAKNLGGQRRNPL